MLGFVISEDQIKIKKYAYKATLLGKWQMSMLTTVKPKQIWIGSMVKLIPQTLSRITLLPDAKNLEPLMTQQT